ncbi:unnamed protein product [Owenia fusiformis]|uniref:Uncharacterized protein n=1 Tax=Owenia fusiformis TaxID=6347 RepID=A0A8J1UFG3_OWEFU|nr:unnamed protein product [Owenia fusiformis]
MPTNDASVSSNTTTYDDISTDDKKKIIEDGSSPKRSSESRHIFRYEGAISIAIMDDTEIEDVSFLPEGGKSDKRSVYEPNPIQRCRQIVCSQGRATVIALVVGLCIVSIALIASLARPGDQSCQKTDSDKTPTKAPKKDDFISTNGEPFPWRDIRLPSSIIPLSYDILMHPNLTTFKYTGSIDIVLQATESTNFVIVHIKDLKINAQSLKPRSENKRVAIKQVLEYKAYEMLYFGLDAQLGKGQEYVLSLDFEGTLMDKLAGFYRSTYKDASGTTRYIATTHFEPTDARAAFPCLDEPNLKATFTMKMVREPTHKSLFNMPLRTTENYAEKYKVDKFETSVKMSTYLVAFIVTTDYESLTKKTDRNITVSVHAPKDQIDLVKYALDVAVNVLNYYEEFFGVKYPLPKQDLIAIPDFGAGAMENWGLITYRMTAIMYDPKLSPESSKEWVAIVVAHELAHQWFGNLVTMKWWNDLWLNEGFASYVENIGAGHFDPSFKLDEQFIVNVLQKAMGLDSLSNSHPIAVPVDNPNEINEIFDAISYDKGSSILRMLNDVLGEGVLQKGLKLYLNKFQFGNAETKDLWDSLSEASSTIKDVARMMDTWTLQMNYPVVTLMRDGSKVVATQKRFLLNPNATQESEFKSPYDYKWIIPFTYFTDKKNSRSETIWMDKESATFYLDNDVKWFKGNYKCVGYYRVNYDEQSWQTLINQFKEDHKVIDEGDRAGIIGDIFSLSRAGIVNTQLSMNLSQYLVNERDYLPWNAALGHLYSIQNKLYSRPAVYESFKKYVLRIIGPTIEQVGWNDTQGDHLEKYLRNSILSMAVSCGHKASIDKATELFNNWKNNDVPIPVNLKSTVFKAALQYCDEDTWDWMFQKYLKETVPSERRIYLMSLSYTENGYLLNRLLQYSLDKSKIRSQDQVSVIAHVALNPAGTVLNWRFVQQNWEALVREHIVGSFAFTGLVFSSTKYFSTQFDYDQVKSFFDDKVGDMRVVRQSLEAIHLNIIWMQNHEAELRDWFTKHELE